MNLPSMQTAYRCLTPTFQTSLRFPQGGSAAPVEQKAASTALPKPSQSSSLKSIMPLLPIIVIALAVLLGIQLIKKD